MYIFGPYSLVWFDFKLSLFLKNTDKVYGNDNRCTSGLYYKTFRIVIYDRNDTSQYYKSTIIAKASLI